MKKRLSKKNLSSILSNLNCIKKNSFDEKEIKEILIDIRDSGFVNKNSLLKEICHFIAHPDRDKGLFFKEIEMYDFQLKYALMKKESNTPFPIDKISKQEFDTLTKLIERYSFENKSGHQDISLIKYEDSNKYNKRHFLNVLKKMYKLNEGYYLLTDQQYIKERWDELSLILRFILSSITIKTDNVFTPDKLIEELYITLKESLNTYIVANIDNYINSIITNKNDIILCIVSLLQDVIFQLKKKEVTTHIVYENNALTYYYGCKVIGYKNSFLIPLLVIDNIHDNLGFNSIKIKDEFIPIFELIRKGDKLVVSNCENP